MKNIAVKVMTIVLLLVILLPHSLASIEAASSSQVEWFAAVNKSEQAGKTEQSNQADSSEHSNHVGQESNEIHEGHEGHEDHGTNQGYLIAMRIFEIVAAIAIIGVLFFRYFLWRNIDEEEPFGFTLRSERIILFTVSILWAVTGTARLALLSEQLGGVSLLAIATGTMTGYVAILRPVGALIILLLAFAPKKELVWSRPLQYIFALALIVTFPLTGHANAAESGVAGLVIAHSFHIAAAALWIGGLVGLYSSASKSKYVNHINIVATRFAKWALPSVVLMILSACWLAFAQVTSYKQLLTNEYGIMLLIKVILMLLVIVIGAFHRLWFMPAIAAVVAEQQNKQPDGIASIFATDSTTKQNPQVTVQRLLAGVRAEIVIAVCLIIAAGWLATTSPPNADVYTSSEPVHWHEMGSKVHMTLRVSTGFESETQYVRLFVWLPENVGAPVEASVQIVTTEPGGSGKVIDIPLQMEQNTENKFEFPGFLKYNYITQGAYMDLNEPHEALVKIVDAEGNEFKYSKLIGGSHR
ncbi:copper resistance D family protein [Paenibacillus yanchengensis]|uniref:Copper resistance D family protein n=1 Tax=Paenibacillus yanchengensis TaxID=2035833 RepID=A0ABW4YI26_9BACL